MVRDYIEVAASWLFQNHKHRDDKCFIKSPAFASLPTPTIKITSPDYPSADDAPDDAQIFSKDHMHPIGKMPALKWDDVNGVKQWLLVCEDPDAPLPTPICHGIYLGIESSKRSTRNDEMEVAEGTKLKGGFYHGQSRNGMVYIPPRPLLNHGFHRYFFDIIALKEPLADGLVKGNPSREQVAEAVNSKVLAWGRWTGKCERRWGD